MGGVLNIKSASVVLVFVLGIGLAFYGGRVYQNNVDQPLFSQYTPASTGGARGGAGGAAGGAGGPGASFFGGSASGTSQSAAALAYATPPGGGSSTDSSGTSGTGGSQGTGGNGAGGAPNASGGAQSGGIGGQQSVPLGGNGATAGGATGTTGTGGTSTDVAGTLVSMSGTAISLKTSDGKATKVAISPATKIYMAKAASTSALKAGQKITAAIDPSQSSGDPQQGLSAGSITIAPSGSLYAYVKDAQQSASGGFGFSPAGTVASVSGSTLNLEMNASRSFALTLSSSTTVYQLSSVDASALSAGMAVTVHETTANGKIVADNIVGTSISGKVASLTSAPARPAGGAGGQGGGFGGGNGGQGGNGSGQTQ